MAELIINNNIKLNYPVISDSSANMSNALEIWMKFTAYLKPEELLFMDELKDKDIASYSQSELDKYQKIRKQLSISKLLKKYSIKECTQEEHDQVVDFMHISLKTFVQSRLTEDELNNAMTFLSTLATKEELNDYITSIKDDYYDLNIYDSYVLFIAK